MPLFTGVSAWRDCLESRWTGRIARLWPARSAKMRPFTLVTHSPETTNRSRVGVSRQSLEGKFCELRLHGVL